MPANKSKFADLVAVPRPLPDEPEPSSAEPAAAPVPRRAQATPRIPARTAMPASSGRTAGPGSTASLRSWYMTPACAQALAEAVDNLHFATRAPKYEVLAAIVRVALSDLPTVEAELRDWQDSQTS